MKGFADSSALVKLYAQEVDSDKVERLSTIVVSALCRVEVLSGLWRKSSAGEMDRADAELLSRVFETDLFDQKDASRSFSAIPVSGQILERAASLVPIHSLRSLDAIQLASAMFAREADPECRTFACFDRRLAVKRPKSDPAGDRNLF